MNKTLILYINIILLLFAHAAYSEVHKQDSKKITIPNKTKDTIASSHNLDINEIYLLRQKIEDQRRFQDQILSTVYWSLGTLSTLAALLVGFGWFANFRMYERDKAALQADLRTFVSEETRKASDLASEEASNRFSEQEKNVEEKINLLLDKQEVNFTKVIDDGLKKSDKKISSLKIRLDLVRRDVLHLKMESTLEQRKYWLKESLYRNALQQSVNALEIAIEIGYENGIANVLDLVSSDISDNLSKRGKPIDNYLVAQLVSVLDSVTGVHAHIAASLKENAGKLVGSD